MKHKLRLAGALASALLATTSLSSHADVIYTLGTSNTAGLGPGPYGFLDLHLIDSTHAQFSFFGNTIPGWTYVFGEAAANLAQPIAFSASPVTFTLAPGDVNTPTYTVTAGNMDGFGSFDVRETPNPNGFSDAVTFLQFTLTNLSGTWADQDHVLAATGPLAAEHFFANGMSAFNTDSSHCDSSATCPVINPVDFPVPEPGSLGLLASALASALAALAGVLWWRRKPSQAGQALAAA